MAFGHASATLRLAAVLARPGQTAAATTGCAARLCCYCSAAGDSPLPPIENNGGVTVINLPARPRRCVMRYPRPAPASRFNSIPLSSPSHVTSASSHLGDAAAGAARRGAALQRRGGRGRGPPVWPGGGAGCVVFLMNSGEWPGTRRRAGMQPGRAGQGGGHGGGSGAWWRCTALLPAARSQRPDRTGAALGAIRSAEGVSST